MSANRSPHRSGPGRCIGLTILAFVLTIALRSVALSQNQTPASSVMTKLATPADEAALRSLLRKAADALIARDGAALESILAEDYTFGTPVGQVLTRAQRIAAVRSGQRPVKSLDYDDLAVRIYGDAAVLTAHYVEHSPDDKQSGGRLLNVHVRSSPDAAWKLIASQNGFDGPPSQTPTPRVAWFISMAVHTNTFARHAP
jgi:uncharacterized protein (TIGR02246 family)